MCHLHFTRETIPRTLQSDNLRRQSPVSQNLDGHVTNFWSRDITHTHRHYQKRRTISPLSFYKITRLCTDEHRCRICHELLLNYRSQYIACTAPCWKFLCTYFVSFFILKSLQCFWNFFTMKEREWKGLSTDFIRWLWK